MENDEVRHHFTLAKDDATLTLVVSQYESVIEIGLGTATLPLPLVQFVVFVRECCKVQNYQGTTWLELRDCVPAASRFCYLEIGDPFDRKRHPDGCNVRVWIEPQIRVELVRGA